MVLSTYRRLPVINFEKVCNPRGKPFIFVSGPGFGFVFISQIQHEALFFTTNCEGVRRKIVHRLHRFTQIKKNDVIS